MPKKPYRKKATVAKTKVDKRQDKQIRRIIREYEPELKTTYVVFPGTNNIQIQSSNAPFIIPCVPIGQGDDQTQRQGDKILLKKIVFSVIAGLDPATSAYNWLRFILIRDKGYNGTSRSYQNIIDGTSVADTRNDNFLANYDINTVNVPMSKGKAVDILMDKRFYFGKVDQTATMSWADHTNGMYKFTKYFKKGIPIYYDGPSGGDVLSNNIQLFCFAGNDTTPGSNPLCTGRVQVYFTDM